MSKKYLAWITALSLFPILALGAEEKKQESQSFLIGHNLTPTTDTLGAKQWTLGTYFVGYGITDQWTVGTSPSMIAFYNMPTLSSRYGFTGEKVLFDRYAIEATYMKAFYFGLNKYDQEAIFSRLTGTKVFSPSYSLHVSAGYQYFFSEKKPYSLRLKPGNHSESTVSFSTLHQINLDDGWGIFLELGALGLNYVTPYLHTGISLFLQQAEGWTWLVGISRSTSLGGTDAKLHPEIQIQYVF